MDDEERMELALNSNFDADLFDCWEDGENTDLVGDDEEDEADDDGGDESSRSHARSLSERGGGGAASGADDNWGISETFEQFSRLPSFSIDNDYDARRPAKDETDLSAASELEVVTGRPTPLNGASAGKAALVSAYASLASSRSERSAAEPSSSMTTLGGDAASFGFATSGSSSHDSSTQLHPMAIQSSANCPPHLEPSSCGGMLRGPTTNGLALPALDPSSIPSNLLPLAMSALAAGAALGTNNSFVLNAVSHPATNLPQSASAAAAAAAAVVASSGADLSLVHSLNPHHHTQHGALPSMSTPQPQASSSSSSSGGVPPFLLFDAPIELRTNFQQSLRAHGLPVTLDNNSYHFGVSVNGFHPQQTSGFGAAAAGGSGTNRTGASAQPPLDAIASQVRLVDARHGTLGVKRIKNAKEQRRAQRIAELIDELRAKMQSSGWSVGVSKSKYNTLSSCAQYVKHLVHTTKEKEEAVRQARNDLEAKRKKLEEEKSQQDPSEPESTTSTLTVSSESKAVPTPAHATGSAGTKESRKRETAPASEDTDDPRAAKKPKLTSHESSVSSSVSFGGDDNENPSDVKAVSLDATTSSVSDLTDSNKDSSSRTWTRERPSHPSGPKGGGADAGYVVVPKRKSLKSGSLHSLSSDFQLDYREVFLKSNVPQLIATTAGRIIAYNEFFLTVTGLSVNSVERATIFNLVQSSKLSSLFEIVAKSLRAADPIAEAPPPPASSLSSSSSTEASPASATKPWDYEGMTLPCIRFPTKRPAPLYITVTLMGDVNPRKRCFHCVLTDTPCTKSGGIGRITPELLETMFTSSYHKHRKRGDRKSAMTSNK